VYFYTFFYKWHRMIGPSFSSSGRIFVTDLAVSSGIEASPQAAKPVGASSDMKFRQQIARECDAMARYALGAGLKMPPTLVQSLDVFENVIELDDTTVSAGTLTTLHSLLADVVAPATPRTIYLLHIDQAQKSWLSCLGPLPTIRRLVIGAAFFTLVFVLSSISGSISHKNLASDIYSLSGLESLQVLIFLMSAAAMGGCFHALFIAHSFIGKGTYDPRFESSYWMRIGLGVIAGLVLSQMIPIGPELDSVSGEATSTSAAAVFSKPLLALLGGFSATLVYTILQRLVETVESLFSSKMGGSTSTTSGAPAATAYQPAPAADVAIVQPAAIPATPQAALPSPGSFAASAAAVSAVAAATTAATAAVAATLGAGGQTADQTGAPADQPAGETSQTGTQADAPAEGQTAAPSATPATADIAALKSA
jgi:hypothetical protein